MSIKIKGLEEFQRNMKKLSNNIEKIGGEHKLPFDTLFNENFMRKYTIHTSIDELINNSGFKVENENDFAQIPDAEWDTYIVKVTSFGSWEDMLHRATEEYLASQLGF